MRYTSSTLPGLLLSLLIVSLTASALEGPLFISSTPSGAKIYIDDDEQAYTTPKRFFVEVGMREIRIQRQGYEEYFDIAEVSPYSTFRVHAYLSKRKLLSLPEKMKEVASFVPYWTCYDTWTRAYHYAKNGWSHKEVCKHGCNEGRCKPSLTSQDLQRQKTYYKPPKTIYYEANLSKTVPITRPMECKNEKVRGYREGGKWLFEELCRYGCKDGTCLQMNILVSDYNKYKTYAQVTPKNVFFFNQRNLIPRSYRTNETYRYR